MDNKSTPNIFNFEYLLKELSNLLANDPASAPRLMENLMNVDYDFENKTGFYKLLNEEQRELWRKIYLRRRKSPEFDFQFQKVLMLAAGIAGLAYAAIKLFENLNE